MNLWWQRGVVYQVYPRSFADGNGDGTGDLPGLLSRLDYLAELGVDGMWISPIFPSPMADFGYDVADYTSVDPLFGSLADLDRLVQAAHQRSMRVLLDYVPNHTSDQHPWFVDSRHSRDSEKRDWYIWRDPQPDGSPPTNWLSVFGGSAWELDPATGQYYYHAYLKQQPDLNWRHPGVRSSMLDVLKFWFDRGIDGFRIDALRQLIKDDQFRDNPPDPRWSPEQSPYDSLVPLYTTDRPEILDIVGEFRALADRYPERVLIGELYLPIERLVSYYGVDGRGLHLPFNFHLIQTPWRAEAVGALVETYEAALPAGAWPNWVLGNHDRPRIASRIGAAQARVAAMLLLTLRGTPTLYQGDELGMHNVPIPPDAVQDPVERNLPGLGLGRDPERTPMQWDATPNAGFSAPTARPWLPLAADSATVNVASQFNDPQSVLNLYRRLIKLRRSTPALSVGTYRQLYVDADLLIFARDGLTVVLNFSHLPRDLPNGLALGHNVVLSTYLDDPADPHRIRPDEGRILD
ncbi:MAG TPA: alpha-amylase family glycosyl hydrolase [Chloroflexota bacterium]|nr:alpha-amylase family glycosyl hydrolase [Chloroflexota bacterium]